MAILAEGPNNLKEVKYFDSFFAIISHLPNPTFLPSLRKISDLSCGFAGYSNGHILNN